MLPVDDEATLPLLFHLNSEPWLNLEAYSDPANAVQYKQMAGSAESVALPPQSSESALNRLLHARVSCRQYRRQAMPLEQLAALLEGAYGITRVNCYQAGEEFCSRAVPSAGGLYPLELYAACRDVEGAADGLYHYNILHHRIEPIASRPFLQEIGDCMLAQVFLEDANLVLVISAVFPRTLKKYGPRGYRYILLEAGHCAQNICLLAAERGLATLCVGGFQDTKLNRLLGFDGCTEAVIYCLGVGYAAQPPDADMGPAGDSVTSSESRELMV
jgi:SagB-type dehydrogenase family enzyme